MLIITSKILTSYGLAAVNGNRIGNSLGMLAVTNAKFCFTSFVLLLGDVICACYTCTELAIYSRGLKSVEIFKFYFPHLLLRSIQLFQKFETICQ